MAENIFRKKALDKISSPEQLDTLIKVTSPLNWLILLVFAIVLTVGILWGIFGRIPTKVKGAGILLSARNVTKLQSNVNGEIIALNVEVGEIIKKGQVLARIKQPQLEEKIKLLINRIEVLDNNLNTVDSLNLKNLEDEIDYLDQQEVNTKKSIADLTNHMKWMEDRVSKTNRLRNKGAISQVDSHNVEKEFKEAQLNVNREKNKLQEIIHKKSLSINSFKKEHMQGKDGLTGIAEKKILLKELLFDLKRKSVFISPVSGRVLELTVGQNQIIKEGEDFLTLITNQRTVDLEAIVYFPAEDGKKIKHGMKAQIAPLTVKTTEYGFIQGIVENINIYPSSSQGMLNTLQNQDLIKKLSAGGAPIQVKIDLIPSSDTVSGLQWTSSKGPSMEILNGTMCTANIIVKEEPPISFIIPLFRRYILGEEDNTVTMITEK